MIVDETNTAAPTEHSEAALKNSDTANRIRLRIHTKDSDSTMDLPNRLFLTSTLLSISVVGGVKYIRPRRAEAVNPDIITATSGLES
jgi:hypothetical protein